MEQIHVDICSTDCTELYPLNVGCDFRVVLDETLVLTERQWTVALVGLTVKSALDGTELRGQELYVCSNVVDFSVMGGKKVQLLRRICLGNGVRTADRGCTFSVETAENFCFYKRVQQQEVKAIHIYILDKTGQKLELLSDCVVSVTLHFKKKIR